MQTYIRCINAVVLSVLLGACGALDSTEAFLVDGVKSYCDKNTETGRALVRERLAPELTAEGVEICLACPYDAEAACTGAHRPKS